MYDPFVFCERRGKKKNVCLMTTVNCAVLLWIQHPHCQLACCWLPASHSNDFLVMHNQGRDPASCKVLLLCVSVWETPPLPLGPKKKKKKITQVFFFNYEPKYAQFNKLSIQSGLQLMIISLWINLSAKDTPIDNSPLIYGADIWTAPNWAGWGVAETVTATKELDDTEISHILWLCAMKEVAGGWNRSVRSNCSMPS